MYRSDNQFSWPAAERSVCVCIFVYIWPMQANTNQPQQKMTLARFCYIWKTIRNPNDVNAKWHWLVFAESISFDSINSPCLFIFHWVWCAGMCVTFDPSESLLRVFQKKILVCLCKRMCELPQCKIQHVCLPLLLLLNGTFFFALAFTHSLIRSLIINPKYR